MFPLFWLDVTALSISVLVHASLTLMVMGAEPGRALNRSFALYTLVQTAWAVLSLLQRASLWLDRGLPLLLSELQADAGLIGAAELVS